MYHCFLEFISLHIILAPVFFNSLEDLMRNSNYLSALAALPLLLGAASCHNSDPCEGVTCSGYGTCNVKNDKAVCVCQNGYIADGDKCVPDWCNKLACVHGTCSQDGNNPYCKCDEGYTGGHCSDCAEGYSPNGDKCLSNGVDPTQCSPNPCEEDPCIHGICRCNITDKGPAAVCLCDSGYTGDTCNSCAPDYAPDGLNCVFDNCQVKDIFTCNCDENGQNCKQNGQPCSPGAEAIVKISQKCDTQTCKNGGSCTCDPVTGISACQCEFPYTGTNCEDCLYGYEKNRQGVCEKAPPCNQITFTYDMPSASSVKVGGDWLGCENWSDCAKNMTKNEYGVWTITLTLPGGTHEYKFNINNEPNNWVHDPNNGNLTDDHFGGFNNVIEVCDVCDITPDPCADVTCNYHGGCSCKMEGDTPHTSCMCAEGYAGANCESCAAGYAPNAAGFCVTSICGSADEFDWRDAVLYFVLTDRFRDSDGQVQPVNGATDKGLASAQYLGGDWKGVTEKMGYLADLGVTAIWLGAPYKNRDTTGAGTTPGDTAMYSSYHGYWPSPKNTDYNQMCEGAQCLEDKINPENVTNRPVVENRLGTEDDLRELITTAHGANSANGQGIKVLFDYVMNHIDVDSDLYKAKQSTDWFAKDNGRIRLCAESCGDHSCWDDDYWMKKCAFTEYLVPFDYDKPEPRNWSVNDALWWAKEYGIDGYRLDAIKHVPLVWLTDFRTKFNNAFNNPSGGRFYLVGETYDWGNRGFINSFINPKTMLDGQFDFPTRDRICQAVLRDGYMSDLANYMQDNDTFYIKGALNSTFLGNHDMPRVIHAADRQVDCTEGSYLNNDGYNMWSSDRFVQPTDAAPYRKLAVAFAAMLMSPGLPLIYYGDEIGLAGGGDPDNRRMMEWDDSKLNEHQIELRKKVKALANIRGQQKAIGRGKRTTLSSSNNIWVYKMGGCGDPAIPDIIIALNKSNGSENIDIPNGDYTDLFAQAMGNDAALKGGKITMPPHGIKVLKKN